MSHSFTSLEMHKQCPRRYYENRVIKIHPYKESPATAWGNAVHSALENYQKRGTPLPENMQGYSWVCTDIIDQLSPDAVAEIEFSFTAEGKECARNNWNAKLWSGKADVIDIVDGHCVVVDWKTGGSKYPKVEQVHLMSMFVMLKYPEVQSVSGLLFFLDDGVVHPTDGSARWTRDDLPTMWAEWMAKVAAVEQNRTMGVWPPQVNNLCGWCECSSCPHHAPALAKREAKQARFVNK
jgi:hypothetical protein